jgi:hypothetical protein
MAQQTENVERGLERIYARLQALERRVAALENRGELPANVPVEPFLGAIPKEKEKWTGSTSVGPVLGKAVLAIAGAYLLRAVAESGAAPRWMMLVAGIAYATVWLVWAVRSHRRSHFASVIFGLTAALILSPLLWEGTVRFHEFTVGFTSVVLVGGVVLSLGLSWKDRLEAIPWIGTVAAAGTAVALIVATHELRPLTTALLALALMRTLAGVTRGDSRGSRLCRGFAGPGDDVRRRGSGELPGDEHRRVKRILCCVDGHLLREHRGACIFDGKEANVCRSGPGCGGICPRDMGQPSGDTRWIVDGVGSGVPGAGAGVLLGRADEIFRCGSATEPPRRRKLCGRSGVGGEFSIAQRKFPGSGVERGRDVCGGSLNADKVLQSCDPRNTIFVGRRYCVRTVHVRIQRARGKGTDLAAMELLGRRLGRAGELCPGITGRGRRMESPNVVAAACSRGGKCGGSVGGGGRCGAWPGGVERVAIVDGAHRSNVRDCAGAGIRGIAMESRGTRMGGVRSNRIGSPETGRRGFAFWKCGDAHGVATVLRTDPDSATTVDPVWKNRSLRDPNLASFLAKRKRRTGYP